MDKDICFGNKNLGDQNNQNTCTHITKNILRASSFQNLKFSHKEKFLQGSQMADPATPHLTEYVGNRDKSQKPNKRLPLHLHPSDCQHKILKTHDRAWTCTAVKAQNNYGGQQKEDTKLSGLRIPHQHTCKYGKSKYCKNPF